MTNVRSNAGDERIGYMESYVGMSMHPFFHLAPAPAAAAAVAQFSIPVSPEMTQPGIASRPPIISPSPRSNTSDDFEERRASALLASLGRQQRVRSAAQQAVLLVGRSSRVHWGYPRNGRTSLCYQVAVAGNPENVAMDSFDNIVSSGDEMLQHYWGTQRGSGRTAAGHIRRQFENHRDDLDSPANRAITTRLSTDK
jgi:hypothetical protein